MMIPYMMILFVLFYTAVIVTKYVHTNENYFKYYSQLHLFIITVHAHLYEILRQKIKLSLKVTIVDQVSQCG